MIKDPRENSHTILHLNDLPIPRIKILYMNKINRLKEHEYEYVSQYYLLYTDLKIQIHTESVNSNIKKESTSIFAPLIFRN